MVFVMNTPASLKKHNHVYLCFLLLLFLTAIYKVHAQSDWTPQNSGTTNDLYSATWTGDLFVAVGGIILTSPDGVQWSSQDPGVSVASVCWSGNKLVAVGGESTILTSPDGIQWTQRDIDTLCHLGGVIWTGEKFIAVGTKILTSTDGILWDVVLHSTPAKYRDVAYNGKKFIAVNDEGLWATSSDGITWQENGPGSAMNGGGAITCTDSLFVVIDWGYAYTSYDGESWNIYKMFEPDNNFTIRSFVNHSIIWTGNLLVCVNCDRIFTSHDAITWNVEKDSVRLNGLCFSDDKFVAVGENGIIYTSPRDVNIVKKPNSIKRDNTIALRVHGNKLKALLPSSLNGNNIGVEIYSISGKKLFKHNSFVTDSRIECSIANFASGRYTFVVGGGGMRLMKAFCVMH